jgi:two-component sensor histidine kinase
MQASTVSDEKILTMFQDSRNRVSSIALIHEKLYRSKNFSDIDFGDYLRTMAEELFTIFNAAGRVRLSLDCNNVALSMTSAIPCGLIVNEVLTNALKYAFPDNKEGELRIKLGIENNNVKLLLADDGVGIPESINLDNTDTLGMKLIQILTDQLNGTIELDRKGGTRYNLRFPREDL